MKKPVVLYIEHARDFDLPNTRRSAFAYFLREYCGYEVLLYDYTEQLEDDLVKIKRFLDNHQLALVVVSQRDEHDDQYQQATEFVHTNLRADVPVAILKKYEDTQVDLAYDTAIHVFGGHFDDALHEFAKITAQSFYKAEAVRDEHAQQLQLLPQVYRAHLDIENDGFFAEVDDNTATVLEVLRIRLMPSELIKSEFDDIVPHLVPAIPEIQNSSDYDNECGKCRQMTHAERETLEASLLSRGGYVKFGDGSIEYQRAGRGNFIGGFAIDPVTLEYSETRGFGHHSAAVMFLEHRLELIDELLEKRGIQQAREHESRLVHGSIYYEVPGFSFPILRLELYCSDEDRKRIARRLNAEKKFIPVDMNCTLLEG